MKIKEMVTSEMPRERLLSHGAKSLSNTELLAILINTGRKGFSSIDISNELLKSASNLNELKKSSINDLIQVKGIGLQKAITLKAAFELGERMGRRAENNRIKITQLLCIIPTKYFHWRKNSDSIYYYRGSRANGLYHAVKY